MKVIIKIVLSPILAFFFMIGWIMFITGEKKNQKELKKNESKRLETEIEM